MQPGTNAPCLASSLQVPGVFTEDSDEAGGVPTEEGGALTPLKDPDRAASTPTAQTADTHMSYPRALAEATRSPNRPPREKPNEEEPDAHKARPVAQRLSQASKRDTVARPLSGLSATSPAHPTRISHTRKSAAHRRATKMQRQHGRGQAHHIRVHIPHLQERAHRRDARRQGGVMASQPRVIQVPAAARPPHHTLKAAAHHWEWQHHSYTWRCGGIMASPP